MDGNQSIGKWLLFLIVFLIGFGVGTENIYAGSLLPDNLVIEKEFRPGFGIPVGEINAVHGVAIVIHSDRKLGYKARLELPLFLEDMIVTMENGRISFSLNDGSTISMAPLTKIILNFCIYNPSKSSRRSFIGMNTGKALFNIRKYAGFKQSDFKIKTKTAVCGVRGSEFIIESTDTSTRITALSDTVIDVVSLEFPDIDPLVINDYEQTVVRKGQTPSIPESLTSEDIDQMLKDFIIEHYTRPSVQTHFTRNASRENDTVQVSTDNLVLPETDIPPAVEGVHGIDNIRDINVNAQLENVHTVEDRVRNEKGAIEIHW